MTLLIFILHENEYDFVNFLFVSIYIQNKFADYPLK